MKYSLFYIFILISSVQLSCNNNTTIPNQKLSQLFASYWEERLSYFPLEATAIGDNRYNDILKISISEPFRDSLKNFFEKNLQASEAIKDVLNDDDKLSKELFEYEIKTNLEGLKFPSHLMPINQFWSFTLEFPQLGSGTGNQPFKTVQDYDNFLKRMQTFPAWVDTAIANMRKGMATGFVLPKVLALKMIPQCASMMTTDATKSIFYQCVTNMPTDITDSSKKKIENAYQYEIGKSIIPSYYKLKVFLEKEYLPACRETHGISSIPNGTAYYQYLIQQYTTTNLSPDSIYALGLSEVARIKSEMEKVKSDVGFKGTLNEFFDFLNKDKQFYPFTTTQQVLDSFTSIKNISAPNVKKMFESEPKTKFEIRQTEAYRAASASAEYNAGSEDGTRPGIFYVPIINPKEFNIVGMETLFLHEAIPGHHYQISLQQENKNIPQFRKFLGYSAYAEGWALYAETLGKELGLYSNPYQYFGHLSDAMHRAIRLVVDVAIHTKGMTREEAINYMKSNERISDAEATSEIERYMAIPGQALSYKIGQLTILDMKKRYEEKLGSQFKLPAFHTQLLNGGNMPLEIVEKKLARWANAN